MPDNWGYVVAAYGFAAVVLAAYWRRLVRRAAELARPRAGRRLRAEPGAWPATESARRGP
jgi:hypothetical protein